MKIVQCSKYTAPAKDSMGTQRVVEALSDGLKQLGHEIVYWINPDSQIDGEIVSSVPADADIVHLHGDYPEDFGFDRSSVPWINTAHGGGTDTRDDFPNIELNEGNIVCVSKFVMDKLNLFSYVYNGVDEDKFYVSEKKDDYFLWLGGTDWGEDKGLFSSILLAKKLKIKLKIAGIGRNLAIINQVKNLCDDKIEYVGAVNGEDKLELLSRARGLLMIGRILDACPVTTLEALMSGTPVISRNLAVHPELITPETGFICNSDPEIVKAVLSINKISPTACRKRAEDNFSKIVLAKNYLKVYEKMIQYGTLK